MKDLPSFYVGYPKVSCPYSRQNWSIGACGHLIEYAEYQSWPLLGHSFTRSPSSATFQLSGEEVLTWPVPLTDQAQCVLAPEGWGNPERGKQWTATEASFLLFGNSG